MDFLTFSKGWGLQPIFSVLKFQKPKIPKRNRCIAGNMFYIDQRIRVHFKKEGDREGPPAGEHSKMQHFAPVHNRFFFLSSGYEPKLTGSLH